MDLLQNILLCAVVVIWLFISLTILVGAVQSACYDRKRELRERAQAKRDAEYHASRMKLN